MKIENLIRIAMLTSCVMSFANAPAVMPPPDGGYPGLTTAEGTKVLQNLSSGVGNSGFGWYSLFSNTTGNYNTGAGAGTLALNNADSNTAVGAGALLSNTTGFSNTATGAFALLSNTTGGTNTAVGALSLRDNTTGFRNTACGKSSLNTNTIGARNTATGFASLASNIDGTDNTAVGDEALASNSSGSFNTAVGQNALSANAAATGNTAIGYHALEGSTGTSNIAVGALAGGALTTGDNNIDISNFGAPGEANTIRIGIQGVQSATYIAGISGITVPSGIAVIVDNNGHLGTFTCSRRFKEEIKPMGDTSEALYALKPVSFRYNKEIDPVGMRQLGLVAEDVEKVNPDLIVRDKDGKAYSVRYEQVNAMLLNEFLKEHRKGEQQDLAISELKSALAQQQKRFESKFASQEQQIASLVADLQKLSADTELSRAKSRTVARK